MKLLLGIEHIITYNHTFLLQRFFFFQKIVQEWRDTVKIGGCPPCCLRRVHIEASQHNEIRMGWKMWFRNQITCTMNEHPFSIVPCKVVCMKEILFPDVLDWYDCSIRWRADYTTVEARSVSSMGKKEKRLERKKKWQREENWRSYFVVFVISTIEFSSGNETVV